MLVVSVATLCSYFALDMGGGDQHFFYEPKGTGCEKPPAIGHCDGIGHCVTERVSDCSAQVDCTLCGTNPHMFCFDQRCLTDAQAAKRVCRETSVSTGQGICGRCQAGFDFSLRGTCNTLISSTIIDTTSPFTVDMEGETCRRYVKDSSGRVSYREGTCHNSTCSIPAIATSTPSPTGTP